jgi:hypothetical protein
MNVLRPMICLPLLAACAAAPQTGGLPDRAANAFTVRTFAAAPSGLDLEVRGVDCSAEAEGFRTDFRTPAAVVVPTAGPSYRPVTVRCAGGGRSGAAIAAPRAGTRSGGVSVMPSIGIGVGSGGDFGVGIGTWLAPSQVPDGTLVYDDVRVVLR